ncbi:Nucleoside diphosphate kinase A-like protein [Drosera capensis]
MKLLNVERSFAEQHYADLSAKPFFNGLVDYIISGPVVAMVWEGKNVVVTGRTIIGATNPAESAPGTIRGDYAVEIGRNMIHGTIESARRLLFGSLMVLLTGRAVFTHGFATFGVALPADSGLRFCHSVLLHCQLCKKIPTPPLPFYSTPSADLDLRLSHSVLLHQQIPTFASAILFCSTSRFRPPPLSFCSALSADSDRRLTSLMPRIYFSMCSGGLQSLSSEEILRSLYGLKQLLLFGRSGGDLKRSVKEGRGPSY